jgi:GT2 family glycosyltransferase/ADP-heptose:LPS heptosyltransferase
MNERKKIIKNSSANRKEKEQKLREALNRKPTASHVATHGIIGSMNSSASDEKSRFLAQRVVKNNKTRKKLTRPRLINFGDDNRSHMEVSGGSGSSNEWTTPPWFRNTNPVDVSIIVPLYKSQEVIKDLIKSFPLDNKLTWEIIFVDDKCPNNSKELVLKYWASRKDELKNPVGKIIYNLTNKGYGQTCNAGVDYALGKYLIMLNADTKLTPNWMEPMIELFNDPKVGIVGNLHIKDGGPHDGTIDSAGSEWRWSSMSFEHIGRNSYKKKSIPSPFRPENCPPDLTQVAEREMVTGCCFTIKTDLYKYIGGFNPNYKIGYWEDTEICMNVRELGYKILYQPNSVIYHKSGHTSSGGHRYYNHNRNYFMNKWVKSHRLDDLLFNEAREPQTEPVKSILVRRLNAQGDTLVAAGVCAALKKKHPMAKIKFCTYNPEFVINNPYIDEFIEYKYLYQTAFDVYYNLDLCYEWRPNVNILTTFAEAVGVKKEDCKVCIEVQKVDFKLPEKYVVIHAGKTDWVGRNWPRERFGELSKMLMKENYNVITVGKHTEESIPCTIDLRDVLNIPELGYVLQNSLAFAGIDSMPMHMAIAVNTPGVAIFGSVVPEIIIHNKSMKPIRAKNLACIGCHGRKPAPSSTTKLCETGSQACMSGISVEEVYDELIKIIHEREGKFESNSILG